MKEINLNSFFYQAKTDADIEIMAASLVDNSFIYSSSASSYHINQVKRLLAAIGHYLWKHCPKEKQNIQGMLEIIKKQ